MTSESSLDSSSERSLDSSLPSPGPSRKRCRSPTTLVPSSTPISRSIAPALADLSPRKRFRDSYSSETSGEEHMEIGTADVETVADLGISDGVRAPTEDGLGMGVEVTTSGIREDEEEFKAEASAGGMIEIVVDPLVTGGISESTGGDAPDFEGSLYDISHYMSKVPLDRITESLGQENLRVRALLCIERDRVDSLRCQMALSQEEFRQIRRDREDTQRRLRRTMTNTHFGMTPAAIEEMINRRVTEALETCEANRNIGLGNGNDEGGNGNGNGNRNEGGNGNGNHNDNDRDVRPVVRECTYQDFMKCQPLNFKGTKGVVGLIRWFENMETVFHINNIQGNVIAVEPTRLQDDVCMANNLMDQKLKGYAMKNAKNKRKFNNSQKDNRRQQLPFKRQNVRGQNVARAYTTGNNERRVYNGPLPLCNKCKFHHEGPCTMRCEKCNKVVHLTKDYKAIISTTSNQRGQVVNQRVLTCFECGKQRHYRSDFPKLKDQNRGKKLETRVRLVKQEEKHIFVSTTFSTLLDIIPDTLDVNCAVKLADGRVSETNTVFRGCTLGLLGHPFNIDLMPVELGSFDVII
ncbi:hypothetical protein Tco_1037262, partial [Tanacetum coccineum]